ncbi:hypothetical protein KKG48_02380 [Patescibacteria group bacterium]|nr:hypothetical protein [Patescibacteria group bacterium]MCG2695306.1 hypothetical protein [Candidatus Parcubacteria bacterium]
MKTVKNFTTTLPSYILSWLDSMSKETNQNKNDIIETALRLWKKEYTQRKIAESYKDAMNDLEWVEFGNLGLKDWININENKPNIKRKKYV